jgi:uncharacterized membrane protein YeaQ/YmgE (transglycosylase-associated protein family)
MLWAYFLGYMLIGLATGLLAKAYYRSFQGERSGVLVVLGLIGALGGGGVAYLLFRMSYAYDYGYGWARFPDVGADVSGLPGYWISLIVSIAGSIFVLAIFKLFHERELKT